MKNNIILIGMPGVGKSTVGVVLAKIMGYQFIDADIVIQQETKKLLKDIINEEGVEGFIEIENRINASINVNNSVIATGGSAIATIDRLKKDGVTKINFLCVIAAPEGVEALKKAHKDVKIYCACIDRCLNENGYILPGLGDAGDRVYGTKS